MWIEKRNKKTRKWNLVKTFNDGNRSDCSLVACGTKIYFYGGLGTKINATWNSFDVITKKWGLQEGRYSHMIPRDFRDGQAVCITPRERLLNTWTSYPDFVK